jgi:hypothetical protein
VLHAALCVDDADGVSGNTLLSALLPPEIGEGTIGKFMASCVTSRTGSLFDMFNISLEGGGGSSLCSSDSFNQTMGSMQITKLVGSGGGGGLNKCSLILTSLLTST